MTETPDHVALTIDGSVPADRAGAMRWMPPEQAAAERERQDLAAARLDRRMNDRGIPLSRRGIPLSRRKPR